MDYVELHCHSAFSLLDGASPPEALVERAVSLGYRTLALTDHDDLGGVVRFAQAAGIAGIGGIVGAELTMNGGGRWAPAKAGEVPVASRPDHRPPTTYHLLLLAESRDGYGNLSTLITRARMDAPRGEPRVPLEVLARHARGLHALTGCPRGWVPSLVACGDAVGARAALGMLAEIFEGRIAVECWDHGLAQERAIVPELIRLARALDLPWVVTNDVHYAHPRGRIVHDVLCCLRHERTLDTMGTRLRPNGEWYLKSAAQMRRRWRHAPAGLLATRAIAERCAFRLEQLRPSLPAFPLPPGVGADEYLAELVEGGALQRWGAVKSETHDRQIAHELGLIRRLGLAGFFLIVWDIVRFAARQGILCQGRGSAANSAVCYALGITAVDPIRLGLLFERFLSEERREAPDIDLDFAHRDREQVLQYVYERYGREHAAMVCEQITYRGRSAVRDTARVLGFSVEQADRLAMYSDRFSARATAERLRTGAGTEADAREPVEETSEEDVGGDNAGGDDADGKDAGGDDAMAPGRVAPRMMSQGGGPPLLPRTLRNDSDPALADALGSQMIRGTEATTRATEVKLASRKMRRADEHQHARDDAPIAGRRLTSADRPRPNAALEPYGSPSARDSGARDLTLRAVPPRAEGRPRADFMDPHARTDDHNERRNPVTALRSVASPEGPVAMAGLDPDDRRVRVLADVVAGLDQLPRHRSIHVGGFVLTEEPLSRVVPIEPASMADRTVIQWEKDDLDPVGLVKIDLLGLGMLTVLQDCLKYIRRTRSLSIDLGQLDMTDQSVYDDLCRADTIGVFQVESRAQMNTLPRLKPRSFYDLVVEVAIIRPGPIQGDMVHPYLRRRAGEEPVTYPHPSLEPILKRTLGVPLFQEQGMQVAIACAGFTPGEADNLRRAMGHKRSRERMAAICEQLIVGMTTNGIAEETARRIYNQINAFADYGFPESHAASFALLVYASAYLRHHYAPEFTAAILNAQPMGFYAPGTLIEDAKRHGVVMLPVDLTRSGWDHSLEEQVSATDHRPVPAVRLGLRSIRGLGAKAKERLERALAEGPFTSAADVVRRSGLDRRALRHLAESGAFDAFFPDAPAEHRRRTALWAVLDELRGDAGPLAPRPASPLPRPPSLPSMSPVEITEADYRLTGLSLNGHPLRHLRPLLGRNGIRSARDVARCRDGDRIGVAGLVICRQRPGTAKGFVFLTLEDETGMVNVVVIPKRFERQALLISTAPLLLVRGTLQVEGTVINLRGEQFHPLEADVGAEWAQRHDFH